MHGPLPIELPPSGMPPLRLPQFELTPIRLSPRPKGCTPGFAGTVNFFFPSLKTVPGAYSEHVSEKIGNQEHPERVLSLKKKRPKERQLR